MVIFSGSVISSRNHLVCVQPNLTTDYDLGKQPKVLSDCDGKNVSIKGILPLNPVE
jgi:hypothetical protein